MLGNIQQNKHLFNTIIILPAPLALDPGHPNLSFNSKTVETAYFKRKNRNKEI